MTVVFAGIIAAVEGVSDQGLIKWGGLAFFTLILYGYFLAENCRYFKKPLFWLISFILFSIHLAIFSYILVNVTTWRLIWFAVMFMEAPLFEIITSYYNKIFEKK